MRPPRDSTAAEAIYRAGAARAQHDTDCAVNGGTRTHGLRGFRCDRCSELERNYG